MFTVHVLIFGMFLKYLYYFKNLYVLKFYTGLKKMNFKNSNKASFKLEIDLVSFFVLVGIHFHKNYICLDQIFKTLRFLTLIIFLELFRMKIIY